MVSVSLTDAGAESPLLRYPHPFLSSAGRGRGPGEGEGLQACSAARVPDVLDIPSIAACLRPASPAGSRSGHPPTLLNATGYKQSERSQMMGAPLVALPSQRLAYRAFHFELDEPVQFNGVFHRQLTSERFHETEHNHRERVRFRNAATHQIEELFGANTTHSRFVC